MDYRGRVVVVGQGYVGLPLAMRAVDAGYHVTGLDLDESRIKRLAGGDSYLEDVTSEDLRAALATGRYRAESSYRAASGFDVAVVTVPTPLRDGNPDLSWIESAATSLARYLRPTATVVLESTTYPGTTEELVESILQNESGLAAGTDFHLGYSPERIDPGNRRWTLSTTPKVVSGIDEQSLIAVQRFYDSLGVQTVPVSSPRVAELTKLLENTFRHVNIALVNEIAMFAHDLDIDVWEALDAAGTKPFGFMRFDPGPGVGGHCLPIDPSYLSWRVKRSTGYSFRFVELANDVNDHMPDYVVRRLILGMNNRGRAVRGTRILLVGLAYKKNSGDARESPALTVAQRLLAMGADVHAVDPYVVEHQVDARVVRSELTEAELAEADAVVILTDHDCFDLELVARAAPYVLDCRRRVAPAPHIELL